MISPLTSQNAKTRSLFLKVPTSAEAIPQQQQSQTLWSSAELSAITSGRATQRFSITGIASKAKHVSDGFAILTDNAKELGAAWRAGASAVITTHHLAAHLGSKPALIVGDLDEALQDLSRGARERSTAERVMVSGIADCLSLCDFLTPHLGESWQAKGCANTLQATHTALANLPEEAPHALFAAPMNTAESIGEASTAIKPHVLTMTPLQGLPLNGPDRWQLDKMLKSLSESYTGMDCSGVAILPRDTPYYAHLYAAARTQGIQQIYSYGVHDHAEMHLMDISQNRRDGVVATLRIFGSQVQIPLPPQAAWRSNDATQQAKLHMAALLTGAALGEDMKALAEKLGR